LKLKKMRVEEERLSKLESYDSVKRWLSYLKTDKTGSEGTVYLYLLYLERWCDFMGKNPDELNADRMEDMKKTTLAERSRVEQQLRVAFNNMEVSSYKTPGGKERAYSRAYCGAFFSAIKSFYYQNFNPLFIKKPSTWPTRLKKVPNRHELRAIWEQADPRMKLWIVSQKDSGISGGDLIRLKFESASTAYGTIHEQLKSGQVPMHATIMRGKVPTAGFYDAFFGEEAFNALQEVEVRERIFDLSIRYVQVLLPKYARQAGVKGPPITPHALRKFFNTYTKIGVRNYGATELLVEYWMGHSLGRTKGAYLAPPIDEQQKIYLTAYPMLSILGS